MRKQYEPPHWWKHAFATRRLTVWLTRSVQIPVALDGFRTVSGHPMTTTTKNDETIIPLHTHEPTREPTNQPTVTPRHAPWQPKKRTRHRNARRGTHRCDRPVRSTRSYPRTPGGRYYFYPLYTVYTYRISIWRRRVARLFMRAPRVWTRATRDFRFRVPLVISGSRPAVVVCVEIKYHRWVPLFDHFRCERTNERPKRTNERTNGADARGSAHRRC